MRYWTLSLILLLFLYPSRTRAQAVTLTPSPTVSSTPAADDDNNGGANEPEKPFKAHWTGAIDISYSNQPSTQGGGQIQRQLGFTGTDLFTEEGTTYLSLGVVAGRQIVEGTDTNYGQFIAGGGLGFGFFQPSLELQWQAGESGLDSKDSTLTLNFQLWDPFTIGLTEAVGLSGHQGPVSEFVTKSDRTVEIDTGSWTQGIAMAFVPWDFLTLTWNGQNEYSDTYRAQLIDSGKSIPVNQRDTILSTTLGADITFLKDFVFGLSYQKGLEYYPAGTVYSPITGSTVTFSQPTTSAFTGYTASLTYNLD